MVQFANLYQKAVQDGSLSDPNVKAVVDYLVSNIATGSDVLATGIGTSSFNPSDIGQQTVAQTHNINSAAICTTGNGHDAGLKCTP